MTHDLDHIRKTVTDPDVADLYIAVIKYVEAKGGDVEEIRGFHFTQNYTKPEMFTVGVVFTGLAPRA